MAVILSLHTSSVGVPFPSAYFRIGTVSIGHGDNGHYVNITLNGYATKPDNGVRDIEQRHYNTQLTDIETQAGDDFLSKCYLWLMLQGDMTGAIPS